MTATGAYNQGAVSKPQVLNVGQRVRAIRPRHRCSGTICRYRRTSDRAREHRRIGPRPAVDRVVAGPAVYDVIAIQPVDDIGRRRTVQRVCPGRAVDRTARQGSPGRIKQPVRELKPLDVAHRVSPVGTDHRAHAARYRDRVGRPVAGEHRRIRPIAAVDRVIAAGAGQRIVVRPAVQRVSARAAIQRVSPRVAVQGRAE